MPNESGKCGGCIYESIIEELKRDSKRNSEQHREFYQKLNANEVAMARSEEKYTNLLESIARLEASVTNIGASLEEIKAKPGKRWDSTVTTIISCIVTAIVVFLLSKVGL